jgi:hypothetical protein
MKVLVKSTTLAQALLLAGVVTAAAGATFLVACSPGSAEDAGTSDDDAGDTGLSWFKSCGDPVCSGHSDQPGVAACTDETEGASCGERDARCDPVDDCNALLVCTDSDPTEAPGGCPISQRAHKRDIRYVDDTRRARLARELLDLRLAEYAYKGERAGVPARLGFIIDDAPRSPAVRPDEQRVDLYGYASMAVATVQQQQREIEALRGELAALRAEVRALREEKKSASAR